MNNRNNDITLLLIIGLLAVGLMRQGGCQPSTTPGPSPVTDPTARLIVFVSEETDPLARQQLPVYAHAARFKLEEMGYEVRVVDKDVKDASGRTPPDVAPAIKASQTIGLPTLAVLRGTEVVRATLLPGSLEAIIAEAIK